MEFNDSEDTIYYYFRDYYHNLREDEYTHINNWGEFIEALDIGIEFYKDEIYKIVDKKKWLLTKIKYGF